MSEAPGKFDQHTANIGKIWNSAVSLAGTLTLMAFSPPWELQQLLLLLTIVVVLTAIVTFISYRLTRTNQVYRARIRRFVIWGIVIVGAVYVVGYHRYTFRNGHGELCAKGFTLTSSMDRAINGPSDHVKPDPGIPANLKDMPEHQRLEEVCGFDAQILD